MKRLLIVCPYFPPANAADAHRVRVTIPYLREFGFEAEVLAVDAECLAVPMDPWLAQGLPPGLVIHRSRALSLKWGKIPGLGTLTYRAKTQLRRLGSQLLSNSRFDLVYFSTTVFGLWSLGPYWKKKFGIPYVVDYQDPWVSDYYQLHPKVVPPGGRLKYNVTQWLARRQEPKVIQECAGLTSVSPAYPEQLHRAYPDAMSELPILVAPFPGAARDFERIRESNVKQTCIPTENGLKHWVYIGRGGDDMVVAATAFFQALSMWKRSHPEQYAQTRIHFIGTSYSPAGKGIPTIQPIAEAVGVGDIVRESTDRISYCQMLRTILDAQSLIVLGSNDPGYTASKLYPYLLARKPMLAIFHEASSVVQVIQQAGGSRLVTFNSETDLATLAKEVYRAWFDGDQSGSVFPLDHAAFEPHTDIGSAKMLCRFFNSVLDEN